MPASAQRIQDLRAAGLSHKEIAAQMGCNQSTISRVLSHPLQQPIGCYRNKGGRPKKTPATSHRALSHIAITNRWQSTGSLAQRWNEQLQEPVSSSTTYRRLRSMAFTSRIACTKPVLNAKQKRKRLQYSSSSPGATLSGHRMIGERWCSPMRANS